SVNGNAVRLNLITQFNLLRDQLDKFAADSSFNGVNLLQGDVLKVVFNELSTSTLDIKAVDVNGNPMTVNSTNLGISALTNSSLDSNTNIDNLLSGLTVSLQNTRSLASNFGSNLSVVQNRQDFTNKMITTLKTGADNLVIADTNEEGANMLALQTRQQLSITALSLANQSNQSVLRLFGG
ncbi:MAG TPA: flagellin, partial [Steroidobacteraceae bacterium]|nr:flagellin [Steroidobacteraceae bacterium]